MALNHNDRLNFFRYETKLKMKPRETFFVFFLVFIQSLVEVRRRCRTEMLVARKEKSLF